MTDKVSYIEASLLKSELYRSFASKKKIRWKKYVVQVNRIGGGMIGGDLRAIQDWNTKYYQTFKRYIFLSMNHSTCNKI